MSVQVPPPQSPLLNGAETMLNLCVAGSADAMAGQETRTVVRNAPLFMPFSEISAARECRSLYNRLVKVLGTRFHA